METEQYIPEEAKSLAPAQEAQPTAETVEQQTVEKNRYYYRFGELIADATDELEKALAGFQKEGENIRRMDVTDMVGLQLAIYRISLELLMRRNPEVRQLHDTLRANGLRKIEAQKQWEQEILATEGAERLNRRKQLGEGPINQTTREELDMDVRNVQLQVEAGILKQCDLTFAMEVRDAGGYYQWKKEFERRNSEEHVRELMANGRDPSQVLENIRKLSTDEYGEDYAQRQHEILTELAGIAANKAPTTTSESTTS